MQNFKKFLYILTPDERKSAVLLLLMILIMAFLEMLGVMSILPFMAVVVDPNIIETNFILNSIFHKTKVIGVESKKEFILILGLFVFFILVFLFRSKHFFLHAN